MLELGLEIDLVVVAGNQSVAGALPILSMAFFRTVSSNDTMPGISGAGVTLRPPHSGDFAEWAALRETSRAFLTPWEPTWPPDDLTRGAFRRRLKRNAEDQRGDLAYAFLIFRSDDNAMVGGLTLANIRRGVAQARRSGPARRARALVARAARDGMGEHARRLHAPRRRRRALPAAVVPVAGHGGRQGPRLASPPCRRVRALARACSSTALVSREVAKVPPELSSEECARPSA